MSPVSTRTLLSLSLLHFKSQGATTVTRTSERFFLSTGHIMLRGDFSAGSFASFLN